MRDWEPVAEEATDVVTPAAAAALHGLFDSAGPAPGGGDVLPPLWHWLAFLPRVPQRELKDDGHPELGGFMPPVELPRRMFAGGRLAFGGDGLRVGEPLTRRSVVTSVEEKTGRSGRLVFVHVRHEVTGDGTVVDEQDIVYREPASGPAPVPVPEAPLEPWPCEWDLAITSTLLFRFSALTYNAHRIHYDRRYATEEEGYPGLVVHGPLQAVALAELVRRHASGRAVASFRFRSLSPAFDDGPLLLRGRLEADTAELAAFDHRGNQTMSAEASLRP